MPIYEYSHCGKKFSVYRPLSESGKEERCKSCNNPADRVYSVSSPKEFFAYDDPQYKVNISSPKQERRVMKAHGHVYTNETAFYNTDRVQKSIKLARKKPIYSTSAGTTKVDRD